MIEGSGTAIYSIDYQDLNGDGEMALLVGWRVSTDLQALSVYALDGDEAVELVRSNYVKYAITDLDQDQQKGTDGSALRQPGARALRNITAGRTEVCCPAPRSASPLPWQN